VPYHHQIDHVMGIDVVDYKRIENNFFKLLSVFMRYSGTSIIQIFGKLKL